jgi:hypothetical protein
MYLPDTLADGIELGHYLVEAPSLTLCVHEPNTETPVISHWERSR